MRVLQAISMSCVLGCFSPPALAIGWFGQDLDGRPCTGKGQAFGPFDYGDAQDREHLEIVERHHFTPQVEQLIRGQSGAIANDLDYTLRVFPNHHRALFAAIRLATEQPLQKRRQADELDTPPECYLQRAMRFRPSDGNVYLLYGLYLHRLDQHTDAEGHYRRAVELMPRSAEAHYNLGILLVDLERYAEAKAVAAKAYELGYPLSGLRRMLSEAGHPLDP